MTAVPPLFLIGLGQDSHRLREAKKDETLHLAGLTFACGLVAEANSDGDVVLHALFNALSTALGGGSIGPVADPLCQQGITDSRAYLKPLIEKMRACGYTISNVSVSIEAAQPKLEPYGAAMRQSLAKILELEPHCVGIAMTSGEDLTACGRGEGIAALANVLLIHQ